jgi:hypothetical protein
MAPNLGRIALTAPIANSTQALNHGQNPNRRLPSVSGHNPAFTNTENLNRYLISDGNVFQLFYLPAVKGWRTTLRVGTTVYRADAPNLSPSILGEWQHVAVSYDNSHLRIFVNGIQAGIVAATGNTATDTLTSRVGMSGISSNSFLGAIDEVKIFNQALSPTDMYSLSQ